VYQIVLKMMKIKRKGKKGRRNKSGEEVDLLYDSVYLLEILYIHVAVHRNRFIFK
jgi:hypothetical protein